MKICILYESKYGNGKKCVEYLKKLMEEKGNDVKSFSIRKIKLDSLPKADFYIFSSPTHIGSISWKMKRFLKKLNLEQKTKYSLMATYLGPKTKAIQKMDEILQRKGMLKVSDVKIRVNGMKGPLEDGYEEKLKKFAEKIT